MNPLTEMKELNAAIIMPKSMYLVQTAITRFESWDTLGQYTSLAEARKHYNNIILLYFTRKRIYDLSKNKVIIRQRKEGNYTTTGFSDRER